MVNKKTLFTYKKGAIAEGTTHQKKEFLQLIAFMGSLSLGGHARYREVIQLIDSKTNGRIPRRSIRGAVVDLNKNYPLDFIGGKQIEFIKINKNKTKKNLISQSQSNILSYVYKQSSELKDFFQNDFNVNERQFYRYISGERVISDKSKILQLAAFITIFLSQDKKFKFYPTFSKEVLSNQIGYIFCKTTPLFSINPSIEEILSSSFIMNEELLFFYFTKLAKELNFTSDESYVIVKTLCEKELNNLNITNSSYTDFFNMMDSNGDFIDNETINRSGNLPLKDRIKILPNIERDIYSSMPDIYVKCWDNSKANLAKLRNEVSRQIKNKKIIKRDLLNDKLAGYFR